MLESAADEGRAVGAFTSYDLWQLRGIVEAGRQAGAPLIVLVSPSLLASEHGRKTVHAFADYLDRGAPSGQPMLLQADHLADTAAVEAAWECGADAILADGSRLTTAENARFAIVARQASSAPASAGLEVELGRIDGHEDRLTAERNAKLTDPAEVPAFLLACKADCLAVSIGNRHGAYPEEPRLDWARLEQIRDVARVPLALHGASGLAEDDVRRAVSLGVAKVNFNTELRAGYFEVLANTHQFASALDLDALGAAVAAGTAAVVAEKLRLLGWA
jgi:tagatose 1,6-diphosphate aldolase GatY/KbaY